MIHRRTYLYKRFGKRDSWVTRNSSVVSRGLVVMDSWVTRNSSVVKNRSVVKMVLAVRLSLKGTGRIGKSRLR